MKSKPATQAKKAANKVARPAVDLTAGIASDVMHQGPRPTCVACALAAAHERERPGFAAAIEPIWWQLRQWGMAGEDGTTVSAAGQALSQTGHCDATLWPYNDALGFDTEDPPTSAGAPPWTLAGLNDLPLQHDGVEDAVEDELEAGHAVLLVIEVSDSFRQPEPDGFIPVPPITAPVDGYHAVLIVGAWSDAAHGRIFLIRNSWGEYWGAGGYGLLPVDYLIDFGAQAGTVNA